MYSDCTNAVVFRHRTQLIGLLARILRLYLFVNRTFINNDINANNSVIGICMFYSNPQMIFWFFAIRNSYSNAILRLIHFI